MDYDEFDFEPREGSDAQLAMEARAIEDAVYSEYSADDAIQDLCSCERVLKDLIDTGDAEAIGGLILALREARVDREFVHLFVKPGHFKPAAVADRYMVDLLDSKRDRAQLVDGFDAVDAAGTFMG